MTTTDQTETRELRERLTAALADRATLDVALADAQLRTRELETALQQVTYHRNRLLSEKDTAWGHVLAPDAATRPPKILALGVREISSGELYEIAYDRDEVVGPCDHRNAMRRVGPGFDVIGLVAVLEDAARDEHPASGAAGDPEC